MPNYRAGIAGCGRIGCAFDDDTSRGYVSTHAGAYHQTFGVDLVALADLDQAKLDKYGEKYGVPGRYQDVSQMLAHEDLDILSICTWNDTHRAIVRSAIDAGVKAIFCEKPIADSLEAADEIISWCAEKGVVLMVDHQRRFDSFHQKAAAFIKGGEMGDIQQATCYYTAGVANTGIHLFDLLRLFFGEAQWVSGVYSDAPCPDPNDPNVDGMIKFQDGPMVAIQACDVRNYTIFEVNVLGAKGRFKVTSAGFASEFEEARDSERFKGYKELFPAPAPVSPDGSQQFMLEGVSHLLDCLRDGVTPVCGGMDGRRSLEIICALRESADADGQRVGLPMVSSKIQVLSR